MSGTNASRPLRNGPWTVLVATLITVGGLATIAVGALGLDDHPGQWAKAAQLHLPVIAIGLLHLAGGLYLGLGPARRAAWLLAAAWFAVVLWSAIAPDGYGETNRGGMLLLLGMLTAGWHSRREDQAAAEVARTELRERAESSAP